MEKASDLDCRLTNWSGSEYFRHLTNISRSLNPKRQRRHRGKKLGRKYPAKGEIGVGVDAKGVMGSDHKIKKKWEEGGYGRKKSVRECQGGRVGRVLGGTGQPISGAENVESKGSSDEGKKM